jgi:hypothetical protein
MIKYDVLAGTHVTQAIQRMVELATSRNEAVSAEFNGIGLIAEPGDYPATLETFWQSEMNRKAEEHRSSPQGKRLAAEAEQRRVDDQQTVEFLMKELPNLAFTDLAALIDWMERLADPSDHIGVSVPKQVIISTFREHGFEPSVNTGDAFNGDDRENFARYLIGQGLSCLDGVGAIHGMFHRFADDWRVKFS